MKMAKKEASDGKKVLITCCSKPLAKFIREAVPEEVEVDDIESLLSKIVNDFETIDKNTYSGVLSKVKDEIPKYDAIFIDENKLTMFYLTDFRLNFMQFCHKSYFFVYCPHV